VVFFEEEQEAITQKSQKAFIDIWSYKSSERKRNQETHKRNIALDSCLNLIYISTGDVLSSCSTFL